ncbi:MAG: flagellar brake protein [Burkholderiales bacterium]
MTDTPNKSSFVVKPFSFADMHLAVGDRVLLETRTPVAGRHYGTLVGYAPGESVLVRTPLEGGLPVPYADGQALTARAFTGVGVFAFETAIQRICTSPFHYLHLVFPDRVRGARIRATERVRVTLPTEITLGTQRLPAVITDLGVGGVMLECARRLEPGTSLLVRVAFSLEPLQIQAAFDARARVQRVVERPHPGQALPLADYGLAFERLTLGQKVMLQNFVYHHLLQDHRLRV